MGHFSVPYTYLVVQIEGRSLSLAIPASIWVHRCPGQIFVWHTHLLAYSQVVGILFVRYTHALGWDEAQGVCFIRDVD